MTPTEPQSAADYDDRTTAAVKSVLVEIGQILVLPGPSLGFNGLTRGPPPAAAAAAPRLHGAPPQSDEARRPRPPRRGLAQSAP